MEDFHSKTTAIRVSDDQLVLARMVNKNDGPFYDPESGDEVIVRKCIDKKDHFAFKYRISQTGSKMSQLHKKCRDSINNLLSSKFPHGNWQTERTIKADAVKGFSELRPDVSGRMDISQKITDIPVVIEVQASTLSPKEIIKRTVQYSLRGAFILWVIPLEENLGEEKFRPRLFERFLHHLYFGRVYYWIDVFPQSLIPVHFDPAYRRVEHKTYYKGLGQMESVGGYEIAMKRTKIPNFGDMIEIPEGLRLERSRKPFSIQGLDADIPETNLLMDKLSSWWSNDQPNIIWI